MEFTGEAGTIIAEDTIGLHKGKNVTKGRRLILQFEYALSMFGAAGDFELQMKVRPEAQPLFKELVKNHQRVLQNFELI